MRVKYQMKTLVSLNPLIPYPTKLIIKKTFDILEVCMYSIHSSGLNNNIALLNSFILAIKNLSYLIQTV